MTKIKNKKLPKISLRPLNMTLAGFFIASILLQLVAANHAANQRYEITSYLNDYRRLQRERQRLSLRITELQSSARLSEESARLQLVKADDITYLSQHGPVALNK